MRSAKLPDTSQQVEIARFTTGLFHVAYVARDSRYRFNGSRFLPISVRHDRDTRGRFLLQKIPVYCELLPLAPGSPMRHTLRSRSVSQPNRPASDLALVASERRTAWAYSSAMRSDRLPAPSYGRRVSNFSVWAISGAKRKTRDTGRRGIDAPLLRDEIVQTVLFERAANPKKQTKAIVIDVGAYYGVSRGYIYRLSQGHRAGAPEPDGRVNPQR